MLSLLLAIELFVSITFNESQPKVGLAVNNILGIGYTVTVCIKILSQSSTVAVSVIVYIIAEGLLLIGKSMSVLKLVSAIMVALLDELLTFHNQLSPYKEVLLVVSIPPQLVSVIENSDIGLVVTSIDCSIEPTHPSVVVRVSSRL